MDTPLGAKLAILGPMLPSVVHLLDPFLCVRVILFGSEVVSALDWIVERLQFSWDPRSTHNILYSCWCAVLLLGIKRELHLAPKGCCKTGTGVCIWGFVDLYPAIHGHAQ